MTIIEQIKAEIERKRDQNRKGENSYYDVNDIKNAGICRHRRILCEELLSFLSTLESEKQMNLEEEINRYLREECSDDDEPSVSDIAHHFAQWGAEWQKEQMMKEAVEVVFLNNPYPTICLDDCEDYDFKDNQEIRIIIVKE